MKSSPLRKQPQSESLPPDRQLTAHSPPDIALDQMVEGLIREQAYELYMARGCQPGFAERDWFDAEQEVLQRLAQAAA